MGSLYRSIVVCEHLGNGTGRRTVTMVALLLLSSGPVRYEAVLDSCGTNRGVGLTCDNTHTWRLSLGQQAAGTMTCYPSLIILTLSQPVLALS